MDSVAEYAERLEGEIGLTYSRGEFWLTLPDGSLGIENKDCSLAAMKLPAKRCAVLLVRQLFLRTGACSLRAGNRKVLVDFMPALIVGRTREGRRYSKSDTALSLTDPQPESGPALDEIPDPGLLLESLAQSTKTLRAIDELLEDPSAIASEDAAERDEAKEKLIAAKDKALAGLGDLSSVLAQGDDGDREAWLARVAEASSQMVEEMADLDGLPEEAKAGKLKALDDLKKSIARYFAHVDPNSPAVRKFSAGITQLVLEERREVIEGKKSRTERSLEDAYAGIIELMQAASPKGGSMTLLPLPRIENTPGFWCKIVLNMHHLVLAVQLGGFHMRVEADPGRARRLWEELRAWDDVNPPRIHIVTKSDADRMAARTAAAAPPYDFEAERFQPF